jgi:hypothetical protein
VAKTKGSARVEMRIESWSVLVLQWFYIVVELLLLVCWTGWRVCIETRVHRLLRRVLELRRRGSGPWFDQRTVLVFGQLPWELPQVNNRRRRHFSWTGSGSC